MAKDGKIVLIDAHALIHRAYHAIQTDLLSPKTGEPTKAVFGFTSTLLKVLKDVEPQYVAAAFDVGKSFRSDQFAEYKATRPKMADDLRVQIERVRELCEAFGIPIYAEPGYEADDLLGALSKQASAQRIENIIVTGDTDTFQLIDRYTRVLMFVRIGEPVLYDEPKIKERYELEPHQLVDLKALRGDTSDNIPGISGIGDKTATRLLQTYGSIEGLLDHIDEIDSKLREKLRPAAEQLRLSKQLVTIVREVPAQLDLDAMRFSDFDRERVSELFRELGFFSLLSRLPESTHAAAPAPATEVKTESPTEDYHTVLTAAELRALVKKIRAKKAFVVDVETTSVDPLSAELIGLAIGVGDCESYYIPVGHHASAAPPPASMPSQSTSPPRAAQEPQLALFASNAATLAVAKGDGQNASAQLPHEEIFKQLAPLFRDAKIEKYAHNAKYDLLVLSEAGFEINNLAFDTLLAAHLLEPGGQKLGLKEIVFSRFGVEMTEIEALIGRGKGQKPLSEVAVEEVSRYACSDADYTFRLVDIYRVQLQERGLEKLFYELEMPLLPVIVELERAGVLVDVNTLAALSEEINKRLSELEKQIYDIVGAPFNLGSPAQLSDALFVKLKLPSSRLERTRTGQISTAAGVLESLRSEHPVIALILEHRELSKLKGTYVDALPLLVNPRTGRVHASFNQAGSVTGRISTSNPNLQNIPVKSELGRLVRRAFIAPTGKVLLSADYSQVELRILAHVTRDPNLLEAFEKDEDIHASTAATLFNVPVEKVTARQRRLGKTINYGVVYGISDWGVAGRTELNVQEAHALIQAYWAKYPRVLEYMERTKEQARTQGYVESLMGRRRYFPELASGRKVPQGVRNSAEREAINMPIQGTASDIYKRAMVDLHRELTERNLLSRMILQVHDELLLECPQEEVDQVAELVCRVMESAYELTLPLKVDVKVGQNWDQMTPLKISEPVAAQPTKKKSRA